MIDGVAGDRQVCAGGESLSARELSEIDVVRSNGMWITG